MFCGQEKWSQFNGSKKSHSDMLGCSILVMIEALHSQKQSAHSAVDVTAQMVPC